MFINRRAPHGTLYAWEALEFALLTAAFDQFVTLAFIDDGVYQLRAGQNTSAIGIKDFCPTFGAAHDYGIQMLYVEQESLQMRGLRAEDLVWDVQVVAASEMALVMDAHDVLLDF